MKIDRKKVLVTLDSMKNINSGLYSFGKSLGEAILSHSNPDDYSFSFYLPKKGSPIFEKRLPTIRHSELYKYYFPKSKSFDLVHFTDQICRLQPINIKARKILTIHDLNVFHEKAALDSGDYKNLERLKHNIAASEKIVAISNYVADDIKKHFPEAASKIDVIYNGADKLIPVKDHIPAYVPQKPFIFSIGELLPKKNFHVLPPLLKNNDFELIVSGNKNATMYENKIMSTAEKHGLNARVTITGPISDADKSWYYQNCLAFAFPSIAEGFGLPIIEAMHFGKPVFLSKRTAVPEVGGEVAFYFDDFEPETITQTFEQGMNTYQTDPAYAKKLVNRANLFSWEQTANSYYKLYHSLLNE